MPKQTIAIKRTGLITSVGLTSPASCAAIRAKVKLPSESRVTDSNGDWITVHQIKLGTPHKEVNRLLYLCLLAIDECMGDLTLDSLQEIPLLLCVAEKDRAGRFEGLDEYLLHGIKNSINSKLSDNIEVIARGRVSVAIALSKAQELIRQGYQHVLVVAVDSLTNTLTLQHFDCEERLLTEFNSNGFIPGEAAGALLISTSNGGTQEMRCQGLGFGIETAHIKSGLPLRAEGLSKAIKNAVLDAEILMHELGYRITDISGEQYYFKEAALALQRTLRKRKENFYLWHPAECIGEVGAVAGIAMIAMAMAAAQKGYSHGPTALLHWSDDSGFRAAAIMNWTGKS
jgi:3-oxoacyl-[acyl-carrier-protein] synthase I